MTISEFKIWFDAYVEAIDGVPSEKQWERIKERVATLGMQEQARGLYQPNELGNLYGFSPAQQIDAAKRLKK